MASPNLLDVLKVSSMKKVTKAADAAKKVEELTKKPTTKTRSAKDVRGALYGKKD